jgi:hypothetical protein
MMEKALREAYKNYISFLEDECNRFVGLAFYHGMEVPKDSVEKGCIHRGIIAAAESALEHSGWRKWPLHAPEFNDKLEEYIVVVKFDGTPYSDIRYYQDGHWLEDLGEMGLERCDNNILYWQPLPEVPNE